MILTQNEVALYEDTNITYTVFCKFSHFLNVKCSPGMLHGHLGHTRDDNIIDKNKNGQ